ncbi:hypothetical protein GCM10011575_44200 [Microlunatus endophyticus]|uniref:DUF8175 domain-containing protein n=1 Tax=Microlunatus endophyticus TaxID=1716077 RepID=A0A917SHG1_9ACTN|nr:hypothetical protein [Microlunatus endophyticus]GGL81019.1 hypothetical protein GCM10011575_44200 [Microlunatus endophyticus]
MIPPRVPSDSRSSRSSGDAAAQNRWTHPGFLLSAGVIAVVVALAIYLAVANVRGDHPAPAQDPAAVVSPALGTTATPTSSPASSPTTAATTGARARTSICGLAAPTGGAADDLTKIDTQGVTWRYQNSTAYPVSSTYGPARKDRTGYPYCYQDSPGGALFTAAGFVAVSESGDAELKAWATYILAKGPYRSQILAQVVAPDDDPNDETSGRTEIVGYRIRSYTADEAWVDIAARVTLPDQTALGSMILHLIWQDGDWRVSADEPDPMNASRIGDLTGYTAWGVA